MPTLISAGLTSLNKQMQAIQAAQDLLGELRRHADQHDFTSTFVNVGPFLIRLKQDSTCARLSLARAFHPIQNPQSHLTADLTVYVLRAAKISIHNFSALLAQLLSAPPMGLPALADQQKAPLVIIKHPTSRLLKVYDSTSRTALLYIDDPAVLPSWEHFSPIKEFIHLLALSQSCLLMHAGSVVNQGLNRSVLLVGPGGSSKSSLTAFAVSKGMKTNGDDYVLVDNRGARPKCWSVYRTLKLHPSSPAAELTRRFSPWQHDALTQKTIYLESDAAHDTCFATQSEITRIYGIRLRGLDPDKHHGTHAKHENNPYAYASMSTIQQLPYWVGSMLSLTKQLYESVGYRALTIDNGITGMSAALSSIDAEMNE